MYVSHSNPNLNQKFCKKLLTDFKYWYDTLYTMENILNIQNMFHNEYKFNKKT